VKVVNGVFQTPANLIFDADVNAAAAIAQSKIANLTTDLAGKVTAVSGVSPLISSGGTTPTISIPVATATTNGYLSALDWAAFDAKQPAGSYVSSVTSGITGATQLTNMMQITAAGYSAITSPLVNTLYIIVG
jgi:hypothetical protein